MPYAAITYPIKPGFEEEIRAIFTSFQRVDRPDFSGGKLLGTAVFMKDDVLVRVIHYEGDFGPIAAHMARQTGVHTLEAQLAPYLRVNRDTSTPEAFGEYFRNALMESIVQLSIDTHPAAQQAAQQAAEQAAQQAAQQAGQS